MVEFKRASDFLDNEELAKEYVRKRFVEAEQMMARMQRWEVSHLGKAVKTVAYGAVIVHELFPGTLHATPCWGEIFFAEKENEPATTEVFWTWAQFVAYMLARYW